MYILCQKAVAISFGDHSRSNKGLHLHIPGRHQCSGHSIQVDAFIALIDMKGNWIWDLNSITYARLNLKCLLKLGR